MKPDNLCGIDVGCTNVKMMAIVNGEQVKEQIPSGDNFTREELISAIHKFYTSHSSYSQLNGLGIAFSGGTSDFKKVDFTSLKCLENLSASDFSSLTPNVKFINDSNATALAGLFEYPDAKVLAAITNGTGIGCGICINGELFTGSNGYAGEIHGNPIITANNEFVKTGKICSGSVILEKLNKAHSDEERAEIIEASAKQFGALVTSVVRTLNPDVVYFAGGAFKFPNFLKKSIEFCKKTTSSPLLKNLSFEHSKYGSYSGCIGAMFLLES